MYKIGVIGKRESVMCFMTSGFEAEAVSDASEAAECLKRMIKNGHAIVFITDDLARGLVKETEMYENEAIPAIITIPSVSENTGYGKAALKNACRIAVGTDILR